MELDDVLDYMFENGRRVPEREIVDDDSAIVPFSIVAKSVFLNGVRIDAERLYIHTDINMLEISTGVHHNLPYQMIIASIGTQDIFSLRVGNGEELTDIKEDILKVLV